MAEQEKPANGAQAPEKKVSFIRKIKDRFREITDRFRRVLNQIYLGEDTYTRVNKKLINAIKVFIVATRKFLKDGGTTKASSIAYTTIVSLIPTLTVGLTFYSIFSGVRNQKEEIFRRISLFMLEHNIRLNIDPIVDAMSGLIDNAGKIGGIGAVIMVFSATAVMRTLEQSLNDIWGITKNRPIILRMIYYWAALTLGPLMLIAGTTVATQLSSAFSLPNYYNAQFVDTRNWAVGNQATISDAASPLELKREPLNVEKVDFENQKVYRLDPATKNFVEDEFRIEEIDFKKAVFRDMQFIGKTGWAVGRNGIIMTTANGGDTWQIEKWGSLNFNDIHMLSPQKGIAVTDNGLLLSTEDGGRSWKVSEWEGYSSSLNRIAFSNGNGIVAGDRGTILKTVNGGKDWFLTVLNEAKRKNKHMNLNSVTFIDAESAWIVGDRGMVLTTRNGGATWTQRKFQENDFFAVHFRDRKNGIIAGESGIVVRTDDGGAKWRRSTVARNRINHVVTSGDKTWLFGDNGLVKSSTNLRNWNGQEGGSFFITMLNFVAPFIIIWLLFLLTYMYFPYTKVPFKPAAIGAAFTGSVWVLFILAFIVYVKYFSGGQLAIYGALAAIPIFLLMIYASSLIVLYGAEVAYTLHHPHSYLKLKTVFREIKEFHVIYGITLLHHVYGKFENGKGATTQAELMKLLAHKAEEVEHYVELFKKEGLILEKDEGSFLPTNSSRNVVISDVIDMIHSVSLEVPSTVPASNPVRKHMHKILHELEKARKEIVGKTTLADMLG